MTLNLPQICAQLQNFQFADLLIQGLGWSRPSRPKAVTLELKGETYQYQVIAQLAGLMVLEVVAANRQIPQPERRVQIQQAIAALIPHFVLIFVDRQRTQSCWYWMQQAGTKPWLRSFTYVRGQPGDLFLGKIRDLLGDLVAIAPATPQLLEISQQFEQQMDIQPVAQKFFKEFNSKLVELASLIQGIDRETDRAWYASVLLNRLIFVYFLQRQGLIEGDRDYLQSQLALSQQQGTDQFYQGCLQLLFFEGFAKPISDRDPQAQARLGQVPYLDGGLFLRHR
ncbi:MAG: hypothetical protein VKJ46_15235, partial [Leptolyngbyaceae bacterium]|nr:hypothetical protein [Leptolyngbyaceae bacterium]